MAAKAKKKTAKNAHPLPAASGPLVNDEIHAVLSRALFEGRLAPGAKLPEHRLANLFNVSRERIRKVLHRLVAERRLEAVPQRGTFVPQPTVDEISVVYEAHRVFEAAVLLQLTQSLDRTIITRIDEHLEKERSAVARKDRAASVRLSGGFHLLLVDALENVELSRFLRELLARSSLMVSAYEPAHMSLCGVDEHAAIAKALKAGDVKRAISLSRSHFDHIEQRLAQGRSKEGKRNIEDELKHLVRASQTLGQKKNGNV